MPGSWRDGAEQARRVDPQVPRREVPFLIATDVAPAVSTCRTSATSSTTTCPTAPDVYVHRIGRTGRAGNRGCAISLGRPTLRLVAKIERYTEERLKRRVIDELRPRHKGGAGAGEEEKAEGCQEKAKKKRNKLTRQNGHPRMAVLLSGAVW